jgi:ubiquitin conjugation factor E4 B
MITSLTLAQDIVGPFMRPELIDRMASMLNYFISQLVGPRCRELKVWPSSLHMRNQQTQRERSGIDDAAQVQNPEKYNFDPRMLLERIASIYVNFSSVPAFAEGLHHHPIHYCNTSFLCMAA